MTLDWIIRMRTLTMQILDPVWTIRMTLMGALVVPATMTLPTNTRIHTTSISSLPSMDTPIARALSAARRYSVIRMLLGSRHQR